MKSRAKGYQLRRQLDQGLMKKKGGGPTMGFWDRSLIGQVFDGKADEGKVEEAGIQKYKGD